MFWIRIAVATVLKQKVKLFNLALIALDEILQLLRIQDPVPSPADLLKHSSVLKPRRRVLLGLFHILS